MANIPMTPKGREVQGSMPTPAEDDLLAMMGGGAEGAPPEGAMEAEEGAEMSPRDEATAKIAQVESVLAELKALLQTLA